MDKIIRKIIIDIISDTSLSMKNKGLLFTLIGLHLKGEEINVNTLINITGDGAYTIRQSMKVLQEKKYLTIKRLYGSRNYIVNALEDSNLKYNEGIDLTTSSTTNIQTRALIVYHIIKKNNDLSMIDMAIFMKIFFIIERESNVSVNEAYDRIMRKGFLISANPLEKFRRYNYINNNSRINYNIFGLEDISINTQFEKQIDGILDTIK